MVYGGTFDPVTKEHINIVKHLASEKGVNKVIVVPTFIPPHKPFNGAPAHHRLNMLKLALGGIKNVEISTWEIMQNRACYTYETLERIKADYPNYKLYFAMGTDMLASFSTWRNPKRILEFADIIGVRRGKEDYKKAKSNFEKTFNKKVRTLKYAGSDISSFEIRVRKWLDLDITDYTEREVIDYINRFNLYPKNRFYDYIGQVLPEKRRRHTAGVILCGVEIAKREGVDVKKTELACLLHDNAKYLNYKKYPFANLDGVEKNVVHQFLGALVAEKLLGVADEEVLDAIRYHTTAKPEMSTLAKIVFTADVIEKSRDFKGVDKLRKAVNKDFESGFAKCVVDLYLSLGDKSPYYLTRDAYNYYKGKVNGSKNII